MFLAHYTHKVKIDMCAVFSTVTAKNWQLVTEEIWNKIRIQLLQTHSYFPVLIIVQEFPEERETVSKYSLENTVF